MRVILMPGFDGSGILFKRLIHELGSKADCTVVSYDSWDRIEGYVDHVENQISADEHVSLVAESFSGPIAIELLSRGNRTYGPAVLSATFAKPPFSPVLRHLSAFTRALPTPVVNSLVRAYCLNGSKDEGLIREVQAVVGSLSPELLQSRALALSTFDVEERLSRVEVPVLFISAARDRLVRSRHMAYLLRSIPSLSTIELDGPHLVLQTNPKEAANAILSHIHATSR